MNGSTNSLICLRALRNDDLGTKGTKGPARAMMSALFVLRQKLQRIGPGTNVKDNATGLVFQVIYSRTPLLQATSLLDIILHKIMNEERRHAETIIELPLTRILGALTSVLPVTK